MTDSLVDGTREDGMSNRTPSLSGKILVGVTGAVTYFCFEPLILRNFY